MVYFLMQDAKGIDPVVCRILVDDLADYAKVPTTRREPRQIEEMFVRFREAIEAAAQAQYDRGARLITLRRHDLN